MNALKLIPVVGIATNTDASVEYSTRTRIIHGDNMTQIPVIYTYSTYMKAVLVVCLYCNENMRRKVVLIVKRLRKSEKEKLKVKVNM